MAGHSELWFDGCAWPFEQKIDGYGPQVSLSWPAQPESSSTLAVVHWKFAWQTPSTRVPWQVVTELQTDAWSSRLQSLSAAQQLPLSQQKPFWQCAFWQALFLVHAWPLGSSGTHAPAALQYALASQSASETQLVGNDGRVGPGRVGVWTAVTAGGRVARRASGDERE
jgi:hypothetical protein